MKFVEFCGTPSFGAIKRELKNRLLKFKKESYCETHIINNTEINKLNEAENLKEKLCTYYFI